MVERDADGRQRPEERFDAAAQRFRSAAARARDACRDLVAPPAMPGLRDEPIAELTETIELRDEIDLRQYALDPLDGRKRWRVPLPSGRAVEVVAGPDDIDVDDGRHWSEGFGDLYEALPDLGEAAVWEPLSHTLHAHERGWAVTVTVDVTFGSELAPIDLASVKGIARAALAARPAVLAPEPRPSGLLRRSRRP